MARKIQSKAGRVLFAILVANSIVLMALFVGRNWFGSAEPGGSRTAPVRFKGSVVRYYHPAAARYMSLGFVAGLVGIVAIVVVESLHGRAQRNAV